ncbi:MAG: SDR family NAD(P)-dependent oxidoreductase, partial [Chloroflexi bacterium]|nr:SDR family NAD(P)-dependent oxidoreductase [Chloroflexota bacterium]
MRLRDRVAVITGANQGIGRAVSLAFAKEGAKVALAARRESQLAEVVDEITQAGGRAIAVRTDVSNIVDVEGLIAKAIETFGKVDILVNSAGITRPALLHRMTQEQWDEVIAVHLKGTFNCMQVAARHMIECKYGKIINVTSSAGLVGTIGQVNYSAAKAGIVGLTKSGARELAGYGISVNAVSPMAATPMTEKIRTDPKLVDKYLDRIPMHRWAEPEEIAPT